MVKDEYGIFPEVKFDLSTPNHGDHSYWRILHPETGGVPSSEHIIWGVGKKIESM